MKEELIFTDAEIFMFNVVWLRKEYGLSKKKMAKILGISAGTLNKIEKGELPPRLSVEIVFNIYNYFGILPKNQFVKLTE